MFSIVVKARELKDIWFAGNCLWYVIGLAGVVFVLDCIILVQMYAGD